MNKVENTFELRLNRLIDGELPPDEYRALLAALENEPDGWRRCALSFLESQALGSELGSLRCALDQRPPGEQPSAADSATRGTAPAQRPFRQAKALFWLAMAASFLAAFALGIFAPHFFSAAPQDPALVSNFIDQKARPLTNSSAGNVHTTLRPEVGNVRLVVDGVNGEPIDAGQVPVYEAGTDLQDALHAQQAMGPEFVELLKRHGFDVQHEQRYVPAPLDDGRQLIVPVDGYQLVPIGARY